MATFRYKPDKIKYLTSINTLDTIHRERVSEFELRRKRILDLRDQIVRHESDLLNMERTNDPLRGNPAPGDIKQRSHLKTMIQRLKNDLYDIENNISELEYYSKTNDILLDYYHEAQEGGRVDYSPSHDEPADPVAVPPSERTAEPPSDPLDEAMRRDMELGTEIDPEADTETEAEAEADTPIDFVDGKSKLEQLNLQSQKRRKPKKVTRRRIRKTDLRNTRNILDFFTDGPAPPETDEPAPTTGTPEKPTNTIEQVISNKATLFDDYMTVMGKTYASKEKKNPLRTCTKCNREKTLIQSEGFYVCQGCGELEHTIIESEVPSHKESISEKNRYPYKRLNHLIEYPRKCFEIWIELSMKMDLIFMNVIE